MFYKAGEDGYREMTDGIRLKTLVYGDKTLLSEFRLGKGSVLPMHSHPHEQTGYLVSGRLRLFLGDQTYEAEPGDSWSIPGVKLKKPQYKQKILTRGGPFCFSISSRGLLWPCLQR